MSQASHNRVPSPPEGRAEALRHYIAGETLCDQGSVKQGVSAFKAAYALAWELGADDWPAWALSMHAQIMAGTAIDTNALPSVVAEDSSSLEPGLATLRAAHPMDSPWWQSPAALGLIIATLGRKHCVVLDGFAGTVNASQLRTACLDAAVSGEMHSAKNRVREGGRSDSVAWEPTGFGSVVALADALMTSLQANSPGAAGIAARQRVMLSRFGTDDFFSRHVDNSCVGGIGPHCNPRIMTAVYYMQDTSWNAHEAGGCLRIFRSQMAATEEESWQDGGEAGGSAGGGDALVDIAPVYDRLVIFWSDFRCPHQVLPVRGPGLVRFAATIWYMGTSAVPEFWERGSEEQGAHDNALTPLNVAYISEL